MTFMHKQQQLLKIPHQLMIMLQQLMYMLQHQLIHMLQSLMHMIQQVIQMLLNPVIASYAHTAASNAWGTADFAHTPEALEN